MYLREAVELWWRRVLGLKMESDISIDVLFVGYFVAGLCVPSLSMTSIFFTYSSLFMTKVALPWPTGEKVTFWSLCNPLAAFLKYPGSLFFSNLADALRSSQSAS